MKELKDFISYFNDLSSRAGYFATEKGNVNLLNKVKVYLQEKNNYTCPIIAYIDDGAFFSKGQRGIVIGTEELIFLLEDRIIHLLYSGIKQIMYVKDGDYVYFNYDKTYSWKLPSIGTDDTYKILAFVILKIVKRQGEGYQLPINIMRDGKESM